MKSMTGIIMAAVLAVVSLDAVAQELSEDEYWETVFALFDDHLAMNRSNAGVFHNETQIELYRAFGYDHPILDGNEPGGFYARAPGSTWLARLESFRDEGGSIRCIRIPPLVLKDTICGFDLSVLYASWNELVRADETIAAFHLGRVCRQTPEACEPFLDTENLFGSQQWTQTSDRN